MPESTDNFHIPGNIRFRKVADEGIVVLIDEGEVLVVNDVGIRFVELVDQGLNYGDILAQLTQEYNVEKMQLQKDVSVYCKELVQAGVLEQI